MFDPSNQDAILAAINKKYENKVKMGNEIEDPERLSTGSLELDLAMGGGIPLGRRTRFAGPFSCGKTLISWNAIANAQSMGLSCAYFNVEKQYSPEFVESRGVDIEKLIVIDETTIEGIAEILDSLLTAVNFIVIDSTKAAVSLDALNASVSDWRPGLEARAWGKAMAFIQNRFDPVNNTMIMIDQVRVKNFQHGGEEAAGGKVLDHASDMTVMFRKNTYLYYDAEGFLSDKTGKEASMTSTKQHVPAGRIIQARVEKSRVSRPLLPATLFLDLNTSNFDHLFELSKAAKEHNVVEVKAGGNYYYTPPGAKTAIRLHGEPKLRKFIEGDLTMQEQIRDAAFGWAEETTGFIADPLDPVEEED